MALFRIDASPPLGGLAGKRVKAVLRAVDAAAAATAAAARANPQDAAAQAAARQAEERRAGEHASFWQAEAHKKASEHGIKKMVSKAEDIRLKIDPVARTQQFVDTARKEGASAAFKQAQEEGEKVKNKLKDAYIKGPMRLLAAIDPTMKMHYEHELRIVDIKTLTAELNATEDPTARAALVARIQGLQEKEAKYQKYGAIARTVLSIVAAVIPVLAVFAPLIRAANTAYGVLQQRKQYVEAKRSLEEAQRQEADAIEYLVSKDIPRDKAVRVVQLLKTGVPAEAALKSVLAGEPAPAAVKQEYKTMKLDTPEAAQAAFMQWLKGWNPAAYDAVAVEMTKARQPSLGGSVDDDTGIYGYSDSGLRGLGFWETFNTAVSNISNLAAPLMKSYYDKKTLDVQLQQMKAGNAPLPTQQAQAVATGQAPAPGSAPAGAGMPGWLLPVGGLAVAAWLMLR